jgi:small ligand-binding sensory domain FIST
MLRAGVGVSRDKRGRAAAFEAASRAMARAGSEPARLCLCFATPDHRAGMGSLLGAVGQITRAPHVVGCSAAGVLTGEGELEGDSSVGVLVASGPTLEARPLLVPAPVEPGLALSAAIERALGAPEQPEPPSSAGRVAGPGERVVLLTFAGNLGPRPSELLAALGAAVPKNWIIGGGAVGGVDGGDVWLDGRVAPGGLAGLQISGAPRVVVGLAHGCRPVGQPLTITRARGNLILELDGRPAFEPFARLCREPLLADLRRAASFVFAGLPTGGAGRGEYLVRSFVGFDPGAGVLAVSEAVEEGQTLTFLLREAQRARRDLEEMLAEVRAGLGGAQPAFGIYVNCAGRGAGLYGVPDHDTAYIRRALGEFPLLGFFSSAEIVPLGGRPRLEMFTGVLCVFAEIALA